ncbi:Six-hairpin glycosidase [Ophiobolus disseminans]|uniref:Six-hairpin glycosidase n=1 Tax=Ophiobolus disseminans TaxID=1469910 RepID=A0A6A6ZMP9_9PLEO|nr:Six-hairpin glycosidase [Ophiobolus disseminans]
MDASLLDTEWIWHPDWNDYRQNSAGGLVHFRKKLHLEEVPAEPLVIQITADTKYQLYINSTLVHAGPVKGDEHMWFYDEFDVQPFLNAGINRISVRVLRFYYATPYATSFPRLPIPGLFVRTADAHLRKTYGLQSDAAWECALDSTTVLRIDQAEDDFLHTYENIDANRNQSLQWVSAKALELPKSHGLTPPWILSPRAIPIPTLSTRPFKAVHNIRSSVPQNEWEDLLLPYSGSGKNLRLPAGSSHHIEVEAEHHLTAMLSFRFQRPLTAGSALRVMYSECYEDEPEQVPYIRRKGNRTDTSKQLYGPQDKYLFAGEAGAEVALDLGYTRDTQILESFSPFHFRTLRFLSLDIDVANDSDLVMIPVEMSETHYPLEVLGDFKLPASNPYAKRYEVMWENSVQTLKNCMHDCYEDCPFYEQLQYAMDVRSSCLFTYAVSADDRMARQAIVQLHNSYRPEIGLIASRSPAHQLQLIPHFSLFWICTLTDHFEHFADKSSTRRFLATCDGILESFARRMDSRLGLISSGKTELATTWDFVDWAPEWKPMGIPPQRTGYQTFTSLLYAYTLQNLATVVEQLGRPGLAKEYATRARSVVDAVRERCWDGSFFTDGLAMNDDKSQDLSEQIQIWAVLAGAVQDTEARTLLARSFELNHGDATSSGLPRPDLTKASMAMSIYTLRAISKVGGTFYDDTFHAFWEPWRHQMSQQMTTWCEDNVTLRSDCHAWSAVPLYEFMTEIAGITPAAPGWKSIAFKPRTGLFPEFSARVPLGGVLAPGVAHVTWKRESRTKITINLEKIYDKAIRLYITFPDGHVEEHVGLEISVEF